jgi:hypothetical protein
MEDTQMNSNSQDGHQEFFVKLTTSFRQKCLRELKGAPLSILMDLGLHINGNGTTWPSLATIANETGYSLHTVKKSLCFLEQRGYINIEPQGNFLPNRYRLNHGISFGNGSPPKAKKWPTEDETVGQKVAYEDRHDFSTPAGQKVASIEEAIKKEIIPGGSLDPPGQTLFVRQPSSEGEKNLPDSGCPKPELSGEHLQGPPRQPPESLPPPAAAIALATAKERREYLARAASGKKQVALGEIYVALFPEEGLPTPGGGAKCPYIGRLGKMNQAHGWGRVHEAMEYARVDVDLGKAAPGDILSWIEGKLNGRFRNGRFGGSGGHHQETAGFQGRSVRARPRVRTHEEFARDGCGWE